MIDAYAEYMRAGACLPPVIVYQDGGDYWLAEGAYRVRAAEKREQTTIAAIVHKGTQRDAWLHSLRANSEWDNTPLPFSMGDLRKKTAAMVENVPGMTDEAIAAHCHVSKELVAEVRKGAGR